MTTRTDNDGAALGALIGAAGAIGLAGLLAYGRGAVGQTNVALILVVVVVVAAAIGGRTAGTWTAVVTALSFNFFHTAPYYTLQIDDGRDMTRVALLFGVGLAVGELSHISDQLRRRSRSAEDGAKRIQRLATLTADGADTDEIWFAARDAVGAALGGARCEFVATSTTLRPLRGNLADGVTEHGSHVLHFRDRGFELPAVGVEIPVNHQGQTLGWIVAVPTEPHGVTADERCRAVALGALLGAGLHGRALVAMA
jgi:hypothetical protein